MIHGYNSNCCKDVGMKTNEPLFRRSTRNEVSDQALRREYFCLLLMMVETLYYVEHENHVSVKQVNSVPNNLIR